MVATEFRQVGEGQIVAEPTLTQQQTLQLALVEIFRHLVVDHFFPDEVLFG